MLSVIWSVELVFHLILSFANESGSLSLCLFYLTRPSFLYPLSLRSFSLNDLRDRCLNMSARSFSLRSKILAARFVVFPPSQLKPNAI